KIVDLQQKTGLRYMMMETVVYAREFLYIKELYEKGTLGKIQFLQASHQQDMDGWPNYWPGLPPMWYATHCVGPVCGLTKATRETAGGEDSQAGEGAGLREAAAETDSALHHQGRLRSGKKNAFEFHARGRPRRIASTPRPRISERAAGKS